MFQVMRLNLKWICGVSLALGVVMLFLMFVGALVSFMGIG